MKDLLELVTMDSLKLDIPEVKLEFLEVTLEPIEVTLEPIEIQVQELEELDLPNFKEVRQWKTEF